MGSRVRAVMTELNDEKIDIVDYNDDPATFIANALSPSRVNSVTITDEDDAFGTRGRSRLPALPGHRQGRARTPASPPSSRAGESTSSPTPPSTPVNRAQGAQAHEHGLRAAVAARSLCALSRVSRDFQADRHAWVRDPGAGGARIDMTAPNGRYPCVFGASGFFPDSRDAVIHQAVVLAGRYSNVAHVQHLGNQPQRTCIGCRKKDARSELLRLVAGAGGSSAVVVDERRRMAGRGAWLHPSRKVPGTGGQTSSVRPRPSTAQPVQLMWNAGSLPARKPWAPRWPQQQPSNLKAGQKTDGNPMSTQR